jgi:hypothetical protein
LLSELFVHPHGHMPDMGMLVHTFLLPAQACWAGRSVVSCRTSAAPPEDPPISGAISEAGYTAKRHQIIANV